MPNFMIYTIIAISLLRNNLIFFSMLLLLAVRAD